MDFLWIFLEKKGFLPKVYEIFGSEMPLPLFKLYLVKINDFITPQSL